MTAQREDAYYEQPLSDLVAENVRALLGRTRLHQQDLTMSPDCSPACQQDRHCDCHAPACVCGCHVFARLGMQPGWNG